jgi:hypothetical protein
MPERPAIVRAGWQGKLPNLRPSPQQQPELAEQHRAFGKVDTPSLDHSRGL